jgi:predicted nucleic acid-binding Zn ribbon protein
MAFSLDDTPAEIACPKCGKKIEKTIGWFKGKGRSCPFCGHSLYTTDFRRGVKEAEAAMEKTLRSLSKTLGVKIKL